MDKFDMSKEYSDRFDELRKNKIEILYISDTFKQAKLFLTDLVYDLKEKEIPILDFDRYRLLLETEYGKIRCICLTQNNFGAVQTNTVQYIANRSMISEKDFQKRIGYRIKQNVQKIQNRNQIIKLLSGEMTGGEDMEQNNLPKIKMANIGNDFLKTECYINNRKLERVRSAEFRVAVDEIPTFDFEVMGMPDIDVLADVRFSFTPKTVDEAVKVLRNELLKHGDLYNGFLASIQSAIKTLDYEKRASGGLDISEDEYTEISKSILKFVIGEE